MTPLINYIKALWTVHDFDYDDPEMTTGGSIDKDVTGEPRVMLEFRAFCKHCGKGIPVTRETFNEPTPWQRWYCARNPRIFDQWQEHQTERGLEMQLMDKDDYLKLTRKLDAKMEPIDGVKITPK